jgi:hypothetical protein
MGPHLDVCGFPVLRKQQSEPNSAKSEWLPLEGVDGPRETGADEAQRQHWRVYGHANPIVARELNRAKKLPPSNGRNPQR